MESVHVSFHNSLHRNQLTQIPPDYDTDLKVGGGITLSL